MPPPPTGLCFGSQLWCCFEGCGACRKKGLARGNRLLGVTFYICPQVCSCHLLLEPPKCEQLHCLLLLPWTEGSFPIFFHTVDCSTLKLWAKINLFFHKFASLNFFCHNNEKNKLNTWSTLKQVNMYTESIREDLVKLAQLEIYIIACKLWTGHASHESQLQWEHMRENRENRLCTPVLCTSRTRSFIKLLALSVALWAFTGARASGCKHLVLDSSRLCGGFT